MRELRWGILGTGSIAAKFAKGLSAVPDADLVAVGSRARSTAEAFALEAKDVVLWEAVASIRARLQALGFEADKERVASMIVGRDFVRRRYAIGGARPSPSSYH